MRPTATDRIIRASRRESGIVRARSARREPHNRRWQKCVQALKSLGLADAETVVEEAVGSHAAPGSPVATTVLNVCLCDSWKAWGYAPSFALGHSVGEVAAAYAAGLYTLDEALGVALELGRAADRAGGGARLHTRLPLSTVEALRNGGGTGGLALAAVNDQTGGDVGVSLCGTEKAVDAYFSPRGSFADGWSRRRRGRDVDRPRRRVAAAARTRRG